MEDRAKARFIESQAESVFPRKLRYLCLSIFLGWRPDALQLILISRVMADSANFQLALDFACQRFHAAELIAIRMEPDFVDIVALSSCALPNLGEKPGTLTPRPQTPGQFGGISSRSTFGSSVTALNAQNSGELRLKAPHLL